MLPAVLDNALHEILRMMIISQISSYLSIKLLFFAPSGFGVNFGARCDFILPTVQRHGSALKMNSENPFQIDNCL